MTLPSPAGRLRLMACVSAALLCTVWMGPLVSARQNPFKKIFGGDKDVAYKLYKDPAGRFQIDYPEKELRQLPSGGGSLVVFSRNDGPSVFVDYVRLKEPFTPGEIGQMPEMELDRIRKQEPQTKQFMSESFESKTGRGVLIKYSRIGKGREWAVHYTVAAGQDLFRVHGVVPEKLVTKYEPIVMHMIQSFKTPAEVAAPAPPKN